MTDNLRDLIRRCLTGEQEAMCELVEHFRGRVFGLCFRMLGQRQDAEDATQETFHRALRSLARWDSTREFEPWLLAIAGNRCRTAISTRKRRPAPQTLLDAPPDDTVLRQAAQQLAEEVHLALQQLRPEHRQAFVLFHENELSYAEIAESMRCPLGTVKTWVHRARKDLIEILQQREVLQESVHAVRSI